MEVWCMYIYYIYCKTFLQKIILRKIYKLQLCCVNCKYYAFLTKTTGREVNIHIRLIHILCGLCKYIKIFLNKLQDSIKRSTEQNNYLIVNKLAEVIFITLMCSFNNFLRSIKLIIIIVQTIQSKPILKYTDFYTHLIIRESKLQE